MIKMINITKVFPNGVMALKDVSIRLKEFVFIVGPSGAGKSTIIKLISREHILLKAV